MTRALKENWRDSIKTSSTEVVNCDTSLPIDIEAHRTPLLFNVRPVSGQVIDVKNIRLWVKFRVLKAKKEGNVKEWVGLRSEDKVALQNNFGFGLFEDVHLNINGVPAENAQREYARSSYLKNLLFATGSEKAMLSGALFYEDTPGKIDTVEFSRSNWGQYIRQTKIMDPGEATIIAPVYLDIFQSGTYFPDNIGFTLNFFPSRLVNCVLNKTNVELKLEILNAVLYVPRCQLTSSPLSNFTVPYASMKVLSYVSPKDVKSFSRSLNVNQLPKKLAIIIQSEDQHHGTDYPSSLTFKHHYVNNIRVRCNGQTYPTAAGMNMDFQKKQFSEAYDALYTQLKATEPHFDYEFFDNGYAIFGIDLPPGHRPTKIDKNGVYGTCDVDIEFGDKPTENLVISVFCFYDSHFSFNNRGLVHNGTELKL
jgi:hypothetical protein